MRHGQVLQRKLRVTLDRQHPLAAILSTQSRHHLIVERHQWVVPVHAKVRPRRLSGGSRWRLLAPGGRVHHLQEDRVCPPVANGLRAGGRLTPRVHPRVQPRQCAARNWERRRRALRLRPEVVHFRQPWALFLLEVVRRLVLLHELMHRVLRELDGRRANHGRVARAERATVDAQELINVCYLYTR